MNAKNNNELKLLADYICGLSFNDLPSSVIENAKWCLLDTIGVAVGAARYGEIPAIMEVFSKHSAWSPENGACVWGHRLKAPVVEAVFMNGIMSHALELDDVHTASKTHIGAVVVPAAWTLAEFLKASGKTLLTSLVAGYETMARIGSGFGVSAHRRRGWHVTGTAGTFGAAAAAGNLLGLSKSGFVHALGMAGTQSSGLWAFLAEGASCKKLHTARAAENGVAAALLAKAGMTGPGNILDAGDGGLYPATSGKYDMTQVTRNLGSAYEILRVSRKPYPCCRSTHGPIDVILKMIGNANLDYRTIESILVETYDVGVRQCGGNHNPKTSVEAQFSIPYTVAAALVDGVVTLRQFMPERIQDSNIRKIARKVKVTASSRFTREYPDRWGCSVTVLLKNGGQLKDVAANSLGSVETPMSAAQLREKFMILASPVIGKLQANDLANKIMDMETCRRVPSF